MARQHSHVCPECEHEWFHENPAVFINSAAFNAMHSCPNCGFGPVTEKHVCDCGQVHETGTLCPGTSSVMVPTILLVYDSELDRMIDDMMDKYLEV